MLVVRFASCRELVSISTAGRAPSLDSIKCMLRLECVINRYSPGMEQPQTIEIGHSNGVRILRASGYFKPLKLRYQPDNGKAGHIVFLCDAQEVRGLSTDQSTSSLGANDEPDS